MTGGKFSDGMIERCIPPDWVVPRIAEIEARLNFIVSEMEPANSLLIPLLNSVTQLSSVRRALSRSSRRARED